MAKRCRKSHRCPKGKRKICRSTTRKSSKRKSSKRKASKKTSSKRKSTSSRGKPQLKGDITFYVRTHGGRGRQKPKAVKVPASKVTLSLSKVNPRTGKKMWIAYASANGRKMAKFIRAA